MRKSGSILKVAFRALARNKLRSLLTTLGIIIGVACVIATIGDRRGRARSRRRISSSRSGRTSS